MPTTPATANQLPLPVRIFRSAMEQQRSLADYAQSLDISPATLHAIVTAQLAHVEPDALERLANLYHQSRETLSDQISFPAPQETFAAWLKRNMEGISQHALRTRAQLDSKMLKLFLNGNMLPDSDQSERLARALYIDRTEVARVVTATMIRQAATERAIDTADVPADQAMSSPAIAEEQGATRPARARRQKRASRTEQAGAEGAAANHGTTTTDTHREPQAEPRADNPRRAAARRQSGKQTMAPSSEPMTPPPTAAPAPEVEHPDQPADRQAGTATTTASGKTTTGSPGSGVQRDNPTEVARGSNRAPVLKAPAPRTSGGQRRSATGAKPGAVDAAAPVVGAGEGEAPASQDAVERNPASDTAPATTTVSAVVAPPAASTAAAQTPTSAPVPAGPEDGITALQLTADEVRLIRHWRQLHPHGRRATLYYIGSLLVED